MIAKGMTSPMFTLVGVVSGRRGAGRTGFPAGERTFQTAHAVPGAPVRAACGDRAHPEPSIPTTMPCAYAAQIQLLREGAGFRRMMRYPPFSAMANVLVRSEKKEMAMRLSSELGFCSRRPRRS